MKKYLKIGTMVQLIIIAVHFITKKTTKDDFDDFKSEDWIWFGVSLVIGAAINIIMWPLTIVFEIDNAIKGI